MSLNAFISTCSYFCKMAIAKCSFPLFDPLFTPNYGIKKLASLFIICMCQTQVSQCCRHYSLHDLRKQAGSKQHTDTFRTPFTALSALAVVASSKEDLTKRITRCATSTAVFLLINFSTILWIARLIWTIGLPPENQSDHLI